MTSNLVAGVMLALCAGARAATEDAFSQVWRGHSGAVAAVAFSPDGRYAASGSEDETLRLWDLTGAAAPRVLKGHLGGVCAVAFSPDSRRIVSGSRDNSLRVWDVRNGRPGNICASQDGPVCAVAFFPDGKWVLSGSEDSTLMVWDSTADKVGRAWTGHGAPVRAAALSPDGKLAVSGGDDDRLILWKTETGEALATWSGHEFSIWAVAFSPDGKRVLSGAGDFTLKLWDAASGRAVASWSGHKGPVKSLAFSRDGKRAVSGGVDGSVRLWEVETGASLAVWAGQAGPVRSVAYSADGRHVLSGGDDGTVRLWDVDKGLAAASSAAGTKALPWSEPDAARTEPRAPSLSQPPRRPWGGAGGTLLAVLGAVLLAAAAAVARRGSRAAHPPGGAAARPKGAPDFSDEELLKAVHGDGEADRIAAEYCRKGRADGFLGRAKERPPEFYTVYARAFAGKGDCATALGLLRLKRALAPQDFAILVSAHRGVGTLDYADFESLPEEDKRHCAEALMAAGLSTRALSLLLEKRKGPLGRADYGCALRLCLTMNNFNLAEKLYEELGRLWDAETAPELHYYFGIVCEKLGRISLARGIYGKLKADKDPGRNVAERLRRLDFLREDSPPTIEPAPGAASAPPEARASASAGPELPRVIGGRFEIQSVLGVGGMGVVYRGLDRVLSRPVAVKKMNEDISRDETGRNRFCQEARLVAGLSHPNIVSIYDIITKGTEVYLVFECVDGEALDEIVASRGKIEPAEVVRILDGVCDALAYAHENRIIHLDLKPANIMLDRRSQIKVMDFGLARQVSGKTRTSIQGPVAGTLAYMAPEQHLGHSTVQSDIFSLGVTAFELVEGRLPFPGIDFLSQKQREAHQPFETAPPALRAFIERCLKADPGARPGGARCALKELREVAHAIPAG